MGNQKEKFGNWSRRKFLNRIGKAGGSLAMLEVMSLMGFFQTNDTWAKPPEIPSDKGKGKRVAILGAGISGLTAAYMLKQGGYDVVILEASNRAGGRNFTARRGTVIKEKLPNGELIQQCTFDQMPEGKDLYINLGPGRISHMHKRVLHYCKEFNIDLEPYIFKCSNNIFYSDENSPKKGFSHNHIKFDVNGYISEILANCLAENSNFAQLSPDQNKKLQSLLEVYGNLTKNKDGKYEYKGSKSIHCGDDEEGNATPNIYNLCNAPDKIPLDDLLNSGFWEDSFYAHYYTNWQPTLLQPVGGMDKIIDGFTNVLQDDIFYNAPVKKIKVKSDGVKVYYDQGGEEYMADADYCISCIPAPILKNIDNNFEKTFQKSLDSIVFSKATKVGWQCNERFWESPKNHIFGGISWTTDPIRQIWYPSHDFYSQKGVLVGAYTGDTDTLGDLSPNERCRISKESIGKFHPEILDRNIVPIEKSVSIAWQNVPYIEGSWPLWNHHDVIDATHSDAYRRLLMPDRRFYITGDQVSTIPGWQEGAMMSAEHVVMLINDMKPKEVPDDVDVPITIKSLNSY
ncbi:flavin monoamine oxidase family protein [Aureivirga sp. CE67]|uniref:flavin monoamine oxidase family protein n=1 Tax=Aureivirga sp. CE67 TaxID=1788983 RepID=UPI0018C9A464|nr:FAD-dependent oxidoreductase [Aureivirga sp. CE67]